MDRFIVCQLNSFHTQKKFLKSNMDRFIDKALTFYDIF